MPTYDYECTRCGHVFEMRQSITARPLKKPKEPCAGCGKLAPIQRLIGSGGAVIFKGTGFYETDYRSESYKKAAQAEKKQASGTSEKSDGSKPTSSNSDKKPPPKSDGSTPSPAPVAKKNDGGSASTKS